jgi:hypothetical protein
MPWLVRCASVGGWGAAPHPRSTRSSPPEDFAVFQTSRLQSSAVSRVARDGCVEPPTAPPLNERTLAAHRFGARRRANSRAPTQRDPAVFSPAPTTSARTCRQTDRLPVSRCAEFPAPCLTRGKLPAGGVCLLEAPSKRATCRDRRALNASRLEDGDTFSRARRERVWRRREATRQAGAPRSQTARAGNSKRKTIC